MSAPNSLTPLRRGKVSTFSANSFADSVFAKFQSILDSLREGKIHHSDRRLLKKNMEQIYQCFDDIDKSISKIWNDDVSANLQKALTTWEKTKEIMVSMTQMPLRIEFITKTYIELLRVGKKADSIHDLKEKSTILAADLFASFSQISKSYINVFAMLLQPGSMDAKLISNAIKLMQSLNSELPVKYTPFCFVQCKDSPTKFMEYMKEYLKKIITRSQQLIDYGNDPYSISQFIQDIDAIFQELYTTIGFEYSVPSQTEAFIMKRETSFDSLSVTFNQYLSLLDEKIRIGDKHTKPWFSSPFFSDLKRMNDEMEELSQMLYTRQNALTGIFKKQDKECDKQSDSSNDLEIDQPEIPTYGLKDVFNETIVSTQFRREETIKRTKRWTEYEAFLSKQLLILSQNPSQYEALIEGAKNENVKLENERQCTVEMLETKQRQVLDEINLYFRLNEEEKKKVFNLDSDLKNIDKEIEKCRIERDRLKEEQAPIVDSIKELQEMQIQKEEEKKRIEQEISDLEKETNSLQMQLVEEAEIDKNNVLQMTEEINKLNEEKVRLEAIMEETSRSRKKLEKEKRQLAEIVIPDLQEDLDRLTEELCLYHKRVQITKARNDISRLSTVCEKLQSL